MSLRRAAAAAVLSTAVASTAALVPVRSATAHEPSERAGAGCVSRVEYKKIKNGMTMAKVKAITGTGGKQASKTALPDGKFVIARVYRVCTSKRGAVGISFTNQTSPTYKVAYKTVAWR